MSDIGSSPAPSANMQIFPPNSGGDRRRGYQTLSSPTGMTFHRQKVGL